MDRYFGETVENSPSPWGEGRDEGVPSNKLFCPAQLLDFPCQKISLHFQRRIFQFKLLCPFIQHAGFLVTMVAADVRRLTSNSEQVRASLRRLLPGKEFRDHGNFPLQRFMQTFQLREFLHVLEIQFRPALTQDEGLRVIRDFAQRLDGGGQLVIRLQLVRLVRETVGMIQLHPLPPQPRQFRFLLGGPTSRKCSRQSWNYFTGLAAALTYSTERAQCSNPECSNPETN